VIDYAVKNAWLVAVLPFLAAIIITFVTRKYPVLSSRVARLFMGGALFLSCLIGYAAIKDIHYVIENSSGSIRWFTSGNIDFSVSWHVDAVTAVMLFVVTLISFLVQLYSREYMEEDIVKGYAFSRFFAELSIFSFSMLLLVLCDNFLMLYAGWELVGVSSFLLIGYYYDKKSAAFAAKKAFLTNRVGDFGFLLGILLIFTYTGSLNFDVVATQIADGKMGGAILTFAALLLFCGAIGKSGQFPLHVWLPDAMEGPTPVSALIHAATMVAAGVFMVGKIMTIFAQATFPVLWGINALGFIGLIGGITAIMAAFIAITQTDIKKILAYSTVSQLGFMILALGMYTTEEGRVLPIGYTAGLFHLFTHAFFKAMLFLCSGSVIHGVHSQEISDMGGLRKYMPVTAATCLIGTMAISGFPLTAGFWSKDAILDATFEANKGLFILACIAATMTAFYMFRLYFLTFEGKYRGHGHPHEPGWRMTYPLIFLSIPSLLVGFIGTPWFNFWGEFVNFSPVGAAHVEHAAHHEPNFLIMGISLCIFLVGAGLSYYIYGQGTTDRADEIAAKIRPVYNASFNKLYFDEAYQWLVDKIILMIAKISNLFDKFGIDLIVNGVSMLTRAIGYLGSRAHNGKVQQYIMAIIVSLLLLIFAFTNSSALYKLFTEQLAYVMWGLLALAVAAVIAVGLYVKKRVFS
jgi:NADH-quinone oxidoreductase subunit L